MRATRNYRQRMLYRSNEILTTMLAKSLELSELMSYCVVQRFERLRTSFCAKSDIYIYIYIYTHTHINHNKDYRLISLYFLIL